MKKIILSLLLVLFSNRLVIADVGSLTATPGHKKIMLTWTNLDGDIVTLVRDMDSYPGTISDGTSVYIGTNTSFTDRGVMNGLTYYYTAFDSAGSFSCAFTTPQRDTSPPDAPGTITEHTPDKDLTDTGSYIVFWSSSNDPQSEIIEYELQERVDNGSWTLVKRANVLNHSFSNKRVGKIYYYRVCAKNEAGLWGTWTVSDGIRVVSKAVELPATQTIGYGRVKVDIPANAFVGSVTLTISEIATPPVNFASSTPKMNAGLKPCYELLAFGSDMQEVQPVGTVTLIFSYTPYPLGTETDYRIYRLEDNWWKVVGTPTIIPEEDLIMVKVGSLSTYVVGLPEITLPTITSFGALAGNNREVVFDWEFPADSRVTEVIIVRNSGTYATTIGSGTAVFRGTRTQTMATYTAAIANLGTISYYSAFASDGMNYSIPVFSEAIATDTTPAGLVGSFSVRGEFKKIVLNWTNPVDTDFESVAIIRHDEHFPTNISDGQRIYEGKGTSTTNNDLVSGQVYYYTAFSYDGVNYSLTTGSVQGSATPTFDNTPPSAPGTVTEDSSDKDISSTNFYSIYWGAATDDESQITSYLVQEKVGTASWGTLGYTSQLYYSVFGKTVGKVYYYRVCAKNEAGLWGTWTVSDGIRVVNKAVELPATQTIGYGRVKVDIPANAFVGSVTLTISEIATPPVNFASSTPKMNAGLKPCYELLAFGSDMQEVQPVGTVTLIFSYTPYPLGTETDYRIYRLEDNWWKVVGTPTIIPDENLIMVKVGSLSSYVVGLPEITLPTITSFSASAGSNREVVFNWGFPADSRVTEVIIVRNSGTYATTIGSGTAVFRGTRTQTTATYTATIANLGTISYYSGFASDGMNYSIPVFSEAIATDTTPAGLVGSFSVRGEFKKIVLNWTNPVDTDFESVAIIRNLDHFPQTYRDGIRIYEGNGTTTTDAELLKNQTYYYTAFSYDGVNYSLAATTTQGMATSTEDTSPPSTIGTITEGYEITDIDVSTTGNYLVIWSGATDTESGITSYELQERKNSGDWKKISDKITLTYYLITGKEPGSRYDYRVRAKNGNDMWGSWSITSDGIRIVNTYFDISGTIKFPSGSETIEVYAPANAFEGTTTFTITNFAKLPVTNFAQSTHKIKKSIGSAWELLALNQNNEEQIPITTLTIFITYPDTGLSPDEEKKLKIYRLNNNHWEILSESQIVSLEDNIIRATITTLSTFIVALPSYSVPTLGDVKVYPNPFKPSKGHNKITFEGLENNVTIRIYKITGELVYQKEHLSTDGYDYWYVTNNHGEPLASGVYIYVIEGNGGKSIGKIAIIR